MGNEKVFDYRGLTCPEPIVRLHGAFKNEKPAKLAVLVDNEPARENVTRALAHHGYAVQSSPEAEEILADGAKTWRILGDFSAEAFQSDNKEALKPSSQKTSQTTYKTLILLTSDKIGQGDDVLGKALMENFLLTLPEIGEDLWRIVLLNGAVKLAATEGKALDSLKNLQTFGVDILVCGACLLAYGLVEQKAVGETTNMLDVVTGLAVADKVISP